MKYTKKAELHCHTTSNDMFGISFMYESVMSPQDMLFQALKQNISIIAITDHDYMGGYYKAEKIVREHNLPLILLPAAEITTKEGHLLAYGISKELPFESPLKQALEEVHRQGGIGIAAHPFMGEYGMKEAVFSHDIDGIEGFNAMTFKKRENHRAKEAAERLDLPSIAGSDAHQPGAIGKGSVWFKESVTTVTDVIQAIKRKDFVTTESHPNLLRLTWDQAWGHGKIYGKKLMRSSRSQEIAITSS
ncbi:PHP domain-containing protein [Candidatus Roizmanbacteria bacterium]|nr:PHP domain-containing protein [Candidatus Roizmanbacteria bacterium]